MLLTAAIGVLLIALFTKSDAWGGLGMLIYLVGTSVAILGWGLQAVASVLPVVAGWSGVLLSVVTGPLGLPVWQSVVIATVMLFAAVAAVDTDTAESSDTADDSSSTLDTNRIPNVEELPGVGEQRAGALRDAGYKNAADILAASKTELTDVDGIGTALAAQLTTTVHNRYEDRSWYDSVDKSTLGTETAAESTTDTSTAEKSTPITETADESTADASTAEAQKDREKRGLVAGLEATCDRIESLVTAGEVAEANDRLSAARAAVDETRDALTTQSGDRDLRLRVNDVEDRLDAVPSEAEAQFDQIVADGDAHVTTAQDAVEAGDVETGLEACQNAHAAYRSARQIGQTANEAWFSEREAALNGRITTVESLTDRFEHERAVRQAEATINELTQRVTSVKETSQLEEAEATIQSVVEDGTNALARLPDDITAPELERRVTHLREQVSEFETLAEHLAAQSSATPPETPAESDSETASPPTDEPGDTATMGTGDPQTPELKESGRPSDTAHDRDNLDSVVGTADDIAETAQHSTPIVLRLQDELTEDGRRHVFHANTIDGDSVQVDVWHRHVDGFDWDPGTWYEFEAARGQHWTVNGESGVTVSTTPAVTITARESVPDTDGTTG